MSDLFAAGLPWWGWALMALGLIALVSVLGALFLPDWKEPDYTLGRPPSPAASSSSSVAGAYLNNPVYRGGTVELLQNGDRFYPAMLDAIRAARDTVNFEVYIFEPDEIGRAVHGRVHGSRPRRRRGAGPGGRVRLVQAAQAAPERASPGAA